MSILKGQPLMIFAAVVATLISSPALANVDSDFLPDVQQQGEIYYLTGGIGDEETSAIESEKSDYNLHIMNADKQGHFAGYPHIVIKDMHQNELVDADGGPLFYAKLPKGRYVVEGSSNDQVQKKVVTISENKPTRLHFTWNNDHE